jgi:hypothetical protein
MRVMTDDDDDEDDDVLGNPSQVPPQIPVQQMIPNNATPVPPYFPSQIPLQVPLQIPVQPVIPNNVIPNVPPYFPPQIPPQIPARSMIPNNLPLNFLPGGQPMLPQQIPGYPAFRQRIGRFPPNLLRGIRPPPFFGGGYRLSDAPTNPQPDSDEEHG